MHILGVAGPFPPIMTVSCRPFLFVLAIVAMAVSPRPGLAEGSVVTVGQTEDGAFTLIRNGKPFFINGAGGTHHLEVIKNCGGNSVRTWGIESLEEMVDGKPMIERARELGLAVTVGIWLEHERHGYNYADPEFLKKQREKVRAAVRKYKDEPALLMWGLGNEMEGPIGGGAESRIWQELNVLAGIVKEEDPNHPVMTVIAGAAPEKVKAILQFYPNIDVLGVNAYAGASGVGSAVKGAKWTKPFVLTEFGPTGHWEVRKTAWDAPVEPSSWDKAGTYFATQKLVREEGRGLCLGTYAFLWGQKQEVTSTWYGMFLKTGEKLPTVDAMAYAWTGKWPANRSPKIEDFKSSLREATVRPGEKATAEVAVKEFERNPLKIEWEVRAESTDRKVGGDAEAEPPAFPECIVRQQNTQATIRAPRKPGAYRLFVTVRDGQGGASKDNFPFFVK